MSAITGTAKEQLQAFGLGPARIAELIGREPSAVTHKLAGRRPWTLREAQIVVAHVREHHNPDATIEGLFGSLPKRERRPRKVAA